MRRVVDIEIYICLMAFVGWQSKRYDMQLNCPPTIAAYTSSTLRRLITIFIIIIIFIIVLLLISLERENMRLLR